MFWYFFQTSNKQIQVNHLISWFVLVDFLLKDKARNSMEAICPRNLLWTQKQNLFTCPWKSKTKPRMVFRMIHCSRIPYYQGSKFGRLGLSGMCFWCFEICVFRYVTETWFFEATKGNSQQLPAIYHKLHPRKLRYSHPVWHLWRWWFFLFQNVGYIDSFPVHSLQATQRFGTCHHWGGSPPVFLTSWKQVVQMGRNTTCLEFLLGDCLQDWDPMRFITTRWWFQICFIFTPIWGRFPFWLIFFRGVETTN